MNPKSNIHHVSEESVKCSEIYCAWYKDDYCQCKVPQDQLTGDNNCMHLMHGDITNFPKLGDGQRVSVSAIPERSEKSVLHFAKKRGIKVVVLDKHAGLYSVFVANGKNMCIAIFRVYDTSGMDFYPCADGSVGWRDKIQLDLFEKGN